MSIPVYKAEIDLGLGDLVRSTSSIAYASEIQPATPNAVQLAQAKEIISAMGTNEGQMDLHYLKTIMVTAGIINLNDDVFDKKETWIARSTPEDKPFNLEHDPNRIRGHITGTAVMTDDGKILPDNCALDDLPEKYHIVTSAVLYKFLKCSDSKLEEEMKQIIAEINEGKWFVSMEVLFTNFDYSATDASGKTTIVPRNEESAFLTKHLRAYGGSGIYENYKIGRLLRNMTFSGKGLVRRPANKESIIFKDVATLKNVSLKEFKDLGYHLSMSDVNSKQENIMAEPNAQVEVLTEKVNSLSSTLAAVSKQKEELENRLKELNENQVKAKITDLEGQTKAAQDKVASLEAQVKAEQSARTEAETKLAEANKKVVSLEEEVNATKAEKVKATRINAWVERTGVDVTVATKQVDALKALSDEDFKNFLETQPTKASSAQSDEDKKKAEDAAKAKAEADAKSKTDKSKLDKVEEPNDAALAGAGVDTKVETTRANLSSFLKKNFLRSGRKVTAGEGKE